MIKKISRLSFSVGLLALLATGGVQAADSPAELIASKLPGIEPGDVKPAPIKGVYEIGMGTSIAYVSSDARYLLRGDIIDLDTNVNLTEQRKSTARAALINDIGEKNMIVFKPEHTKYKMTVFTDIDCGYCRKLHNEMAQLNDLGVEVHYVFYPRSGPGTKSWEKAESVWCADDRNGALTHAKQGQDVATKTCGETPIARHFEAGRNVGVRGTPAILTEDGTLISGYLPAAQLAARLESDKRLSAAR